MPPAPPTDIISDYKAKTPDHLRLRTALLSDHPVVYIPKKKQRDDNDIMQAEELSPVGVVI